MKIFEFLAKMLEFLAKILEFLKKKYFRKNCLEFCTLERNFNIFVNKNAKKYPTHLPIIFEFIFVEYLEKVPVP